MVLEVRHLRLIDSIASHGTLTRASTQLHLTQSALSHQLRDLESALGANLFDRSGRRMVPTQAGLRLLATARETLGTLERAEAEMRRGATGREAVLRLSTECYTCYHWLPQVLTPFHRRFPSCEIRVDATATLSPLTALLAGRLDLALVNHRVRDRRLRYLPLFEDELVVVMAPSHPLARRPHVAAEDFAREHVILYVTPREHSTLFQEVLVPAGVTPARVSEMPLTEAILELVKAGLGITVLARWAVEPAVAAGALVARPLTAKRFRRRWYAAVMRYKRTPEHLEEFARLLVRGPGLLRAPDSPARKSRRATPRARTA